MFVTQCCDPDVRVRVVSAAPENHKQHHLLKDQCMPLPVTRFVHVLNAQAVQDQLWCCKRCTHFSCLDIRHIEHLALPPPRLQRCAPQRQLIVSTVIIHFGLSSRLHPALCTALCLRLSPTPFLSLHFSLCFSPARHIPHTSPLLDGPDFPNFGPPHQAMASNGPSRCRPRAAPSMASPQLPGRDLTEAGSSC